MFVADIDAGVAIPVSRSREWVRSNQSHRKRDNRKEENHFSRCVRPCVVFNPVATSMYQNAWETRDVPVIHPVPGKCWISHYSVLPGPGKIMGPSNKKKNYFSFFYPRY